MHGKLCKNGAIIVQKEWDLLHFNNIAVRQDMSAHEALSETREINETIPQRIIGIEPEQHRFKKGTI